MEYSKLLMESLNREADEEREAGRSLDVVITGSTVNGVRYRNRRINNITIKFANDHFWVHGFDPDKQGVRFFRMDLIERMEGYEQWAQRIAKVAS